MPKSLGVAQSTCLSLLLMRLFFAMKLLLTVKTLKLLRMYCVNGETITSELYIDSKRARQIPEEGGSKVTQLNPLKTGFLLPRCRLSLASTARRATTVYRSSVQTAEQRPACRHRCPSGRSSPAIAGDSHSLAVLSLYATSHRLLFGHPLRPPKMCGSSELDPPPDRNSMQTVFFYILETSCRMTGR